jgi:hypothetical protein
MGDARSSISFFLFPNVNLIGMLKHFILITVIKLIEMV